MEEETIFHKIVRGEVPCHKIWEDEDFLAFLSIFPNTEGTTVVIPKKYHPSYFADISDSVLSDLILASKKVAKILDNGLDDVGRTALVFEGFGVNYLHAKLFPMHGTKDMKEWSPIESQNLQDVYFEKYPGYISSHDAALSDNDILSSVAKKIRSRNNLE